MIHINAWNNLTLLTKLNSLKLNLAQSAGNVEFTDCFSAVGLDSPNDCLDNDIKQSDGEVPVILGLCGMRTTILLLSLPGPLWLGEVAPDRVLSMDLNCLTELLEIELFLHLTVCK